MRSKIRVKTEGSQPYFPSRWEVKSVAGLVTKARDGAAQETVRMVNTSDNKPGLEALANTAHHCGPRLPFQVKKSQNMWEWQTVQPLQNLATSNKSVHAFTLNFNVTLALYSHFKKYESQLCCVTHCSTIWFFKMLIWKLLKRYRQTSGITCYLPVLEYYATMEKNRKISMN